MQSTSPKLVKNLDNRKPRQVTFRDNTKALEFERMCKEKKDNMIAETLLGRDLIVDLQQCALIMYMHPSDLLKIALHKGLKEIKRNHYSLT